MNIKFNLLWLSAFLALLGSMVAPAIADEWNKETKIEFSGPVQVPGKLLEAGKYVFKLADSESDRHIVQILSEDASGAQKLVTTVLAIPAYRLATPDAPIVQLEERPSGGPEAIHSWFYPGDNAGFAFVYPKGQSLEASLNTAPTPVSTPHPTRHAELSGTWSGILTACTSFTTVASANTDVAAKFHAGWPSRVKGWSRLPAEDRHQVGWPALQ